MRALSAEGVLSVNPTALLVIDGSGPKETLDVLAKTSLPIATVPEAFTRDGIIRKIEAVGKVLQVEPKAKVLAEKIGAEIDAAAADAAKVPAEKRKRVLFVLTMQNGKIMAAGTHSAADGILVLSGAINATASFAGYKPLNDEVIIEAKPDAILMMDRGDGSGISDDQLFSHPAIALTPAAATRTVIRLDGNTLLGFGPRTATGIRQLSQALYGE